MTILSNLLSRTSSPAEKDMIQSARKYTIGKNIEKFLVSQVESPLVRSLYNYAMEQSRPATRQTSRTREKTETTVTRQNDLKSIGGKIDDIRRSILAIRKIIQSLQTSLQNITGSMIPPPDRSLSGSAAKMFATAGMDTSDLFKPMTVSADDKEYLYYPGAPQGRQFYKKTKEGKAGFIAPSDKTQQLYRALAQKIDEIKSSISGTEPSMMTTASPVSGMLSAAKGNPELNYSPKDYGEVKEVDSKEEEELLQKALEKALRVVLPKVLDQAQLQSPSGGMGGLLSMLGIGALGTAISGLAKKSAGALKGFGTKVGAFLAPKFLKRTPTATAAATPAAAAADDLTRMAVQQATEEAAEATAAKAGTAAATSAASAAANATTTAGAKGIGSLLGLLGKGASGAAKFLPGVGLAASGYFAYERAKKGDYLGAGIDALSGVASLIPGIGTAAAIGLQGINLGRDLSTPTATPNMISDDLPASIIERTSSMNALSQQVVPPVIVNNNVQQPNSQQNKPPPQSEPVVSTRNFENSFVRAVSSDYVHPASAYKFT